MAASHVLRSVRAEEAAQLQSDPVQIPLPSNITTWTSHKKPYGATAFLATIAILQLPNYTEQECLLCCSLLTALTVFFYSTKNQSEEEEIQRKIHRNQSEIIYREHICVWKLLCRCYMSLRRCTHPVEDTLFNNSGARHIGTEVVVCESLCISELCVLE